MFLILFMIHATLEYSMIAKHLKRSSRGGGGTCHKNTDAYFNELMKGSENKLGTVDYCDVVQIRMIATLLSF
jgi:hypothetical protein